MFILLIITTLIGGIVGYFNQQILLYSFYGFLIGLIIIMITKSKGGDGIDDAFDSFDD